MCWKKALKVPSYHQHVTVKCRRRKQMKKNWGLSSCGLHFSYFIWFEEKLQKKEKHRFSFSFSSLFSWFINCEEKFDFIFLLSPFFFSKRIHEKSLSFPENYVANLYSVEWRLFRVVTFINDSMMIWTLQPLNSLNI